MPAKRCRTRPACAGCSGLPSIFVGPPLVALRQHAVAQRRPASSPWRRTAAGPESDPPAAGRTARCARSAGACTPSSPASASDAPISFRKLRRPSTGFSSSLQPIACCGNSRSTQIAELRRRGQVVQAAPVFAPARAVQPRPRPRPGPVCSVVHSSMASGTAGQTSARSESCIRGLVRRVRFLSDRPPADIPSWLRIRAGGGTFRDSGGSSRHHSICSEFSCHVSGIWSTRPWQVSQPTPLLT